MFGNSKEKSSSASGPADLESEDSAPISVLISSLKTCSSNPCPLAGVFPLVTLSDSKNPRDETVSTEIRINFDK